jgi:hypothetical protein
MTGKWHLCAPARDCVLAGKFDVISHNYSIRHDI